MYAIHCRTPTGWGIVILICAAALLFAASSAQPPSTGNDQMIVRWLDTPIIVAMPWLLDPYSGVAALNL